MNEFHPLSLAAGTKANSNVLNHREAMKAEDRELCIQAMEEEFERMSGHTEEKQNQQVKSTDINPVSVPMAASNNMA
eukprot:5098755-Ditylum_brightwellii.AAC.1